MKKIVLTCGPSCESDELLNALAPLASSFRLNVAHLHGDSLKNWLVRLEKLRTDHDLNFSVVLDLQGAKVRIGEYPSVAVIPQEIELVLADTSQRPDQIPVPAESVFAMTRVGDRLVLNDRKIIVRVIEKAAGVLGARVEQNGPLSSGKGINSPDRVFEMARIMPGDLEAIKVSSAFVNIDYAVSFVADGSEADLFRPLIRAGRLIAKIEQVAAFEHLERIDRSFDELWLCRGDLGAEAGLKKLGSLQREFVAALQNRLSRPSLIAGEVLGSMVFQPQPGRAEIVQLDDALNDGFAGIVLSDETACGNQIRAVADFLSYYFADQPGKQC